MAICNYITSFESITLTEENRQRLMGYFLYADTFDWTTFEEVPSHFSVEETNASQYMLEFTDIDDFCIYTDNIEVINKKKEEVNFLPYRIYKKQNNIWLLIDEQKETIQFTTKSVEEYYTITVDKIISGLFLETIETITVPIFREIQVEESHCGLKGWDYGEYHDGFKSFVEMKKYIDDDLPFLANIQNIQKGMRTDPKVIEEVKRVIDAIADNIVVKYSKIALPMISDERLRQVKMQRTGFYLLQEVQDAMIWANDLTN